MIDLTGKTPAEATAALRAAGFNGELVVNRTALECVDAQRVPGHINCQNPEPGKLYYKTHEIDVHVFEEQTHEGRLVREQLAKAVGMTVADAKKYFKSIGHTGEIEVEEGGQYGFFKNCAKDRVCSVGPEGGIGVNDRIWLHLNKKSVDITMPD
jgi:beta-lactam-binding protein with PASTA domain